MVTVGHAESSRGSAGCVPGCSSSAGARRRTGRIFPCYDRICGSSWSCERARGDLTPSPDEALPLRQEVMQTHRPAPFAWCGWFLQSIAEYELGRFLPAHPLNIQDRPVPVLAVHVQPGDLDGAVAEVGDPLVSEMEVPVHQPAGLHGLHYIF